MAVDKDLRSRGGAEGLENLLRIAQSHDENLLVTKLMRG
jgi:hypothetical protein